MQKLWQTIVELIDRYLDWFGRLALFVIYFWFGILKLFNLSPATPLAQALTAKTVGLAHYSTLFHVLAVVECIIGLMFLVPKLTRLAFGLLLVHMFIVCGPLVLVPNLTWSKFLVPTLEGQYIIKNLAIVAVALNVLKQYENTSSKA